MKLQKRLAASILNCSPKKIIFDTTKLKEIKEAITKEDIRRLIVKGYIKKEKFVGQSRVRARKRKEQQKKGRRKGKGSRKGTKKARTDKKRTWINKIRAQRKLLKELKDKERITSSAYRNLYKKAKTGFFRSKRHLLTYLKENNLLKENKNKG